MHLDVPSTIHDDPCLHAIVAHSVTAASPDVFAIHGTNPVACFIDQMPVAGSIALADGNWPAILACQVNNWFTFV